MLSNLINTAQAATQGAAQPSAADTEYATAWNGPSANATGAGGDLFGAASAALAPMAAGQAAPVHSSGLLGSTAASPGAAVTGTQGGAGSIGMFGGSAATPTMPTVQPVTPAPAAQPTSADEYANAWHGNAGAAALPMADDPRQMQRQMRMGGAHTALR